MKHPHPTPESPSPAAPSLPPELAARLAAYVELLLRWNGRINLVGRATEAQLRERHVQDCLQLLPLLPRGDGPVADLGSGAGLPGLVLAMASPRPMHLVESDRRKAAFLTEAAARLVLPHVRVHPTRIETVKLPPLAAVTARALAPLDALLAHAARLLAPGGIALFPKGRGAAEEISAAQRTWSFTLSRHPSQTDPDATLLHLSDIRHVQPQA
ncbi:16S rRNA (guanine(527)-N(7))-methyltransferase RsmG [Falsiroseomonas selenitidurans]|uniref:16S rRNA (guanine(527)-N(7))-methyltransferase RsmG n=1 Tax=Falsiroseomonas selenitidurans TaxID=2716335 RepID=UPI002E2C6D73|nr:16S rRNA (guanine(527)-N(7))-methyltransferase RsmG [Falsiroseomonas selenitidurans]